MKKIFLTFLLISYLFMPVLVLAEQTANWSATGDWGREEKKYQTQIFLEEEAKIVKPGVLPNSFWYWADRLLEKVRLALTVGRENRADYLMKIAQERLAEMQALSEQGITKYAEELLTEHEDLVNRAEKLYFELKEESIRRAQELQVKTEKNILITEYRLKKHVAESEQKYIEKEASLGEKLGQVMAVILNHLSWKKDKIEEQRTEMFD